MDIVVNNENIMGKLLAGRQLVNKRIRNHLEKSLVPHLLPHKPLSISSEKTMRKGRPEHN